MIAIKPASRADAAAIQRIYNAGIDSRLATFETERRIVADIERWFDDGHIVHGAYLSGSLIGFASVFCYRDRECYAGVGEFSIYVDDERRGSGVGKKLLEGLVAVAEAAGYWKLLSRVFPENERCRRLLAKCHFREVGVYENHAQLDGAWRDVVIVERLLGPAMETR